MSDDGHTGSCEVAKVEPEFEWTLASRYDGAPIRLTSSANYEIEVTIGNEVVYPNAMDLLEAVARVALCTCPDEARAFLSGRALPPEEGS